MKRVSTGKNEAIASIPNIAGIVIAGIQPTLAIVIAIHIEHMAIAIRVDFVQNAVHTTIP